MKKISKGNISCIVIFLVIFLDQALKVLVKTNMALHESIKVTDWFYIFFTENNGMAYGIEFFDKFFLTAFRLIASVLLIIYLNRICKRKNVPTGFCVTIGLIIAGAIGNVIDCMFYGMIFDNSVGHVATLFPSGGGYAAFMYGKVVDMLYFPLVEWNWPGFLPFIGGNHFIFFSPIFNIADSSISVGVFLLLIFYRSEFVDKKDNVIKYSKE